MRRSPRPAEGRGASAGDGRFELEPRHPTSSTSSSSRSREPAELNCAFCGREFASLEALDRHIRQAHTGRPFPPLCEICGQVFESPADLKAHHEAIHRSGRA